MRSEPPNAFSQATDANYRGARNITAAALRQVAAPWAVMRDDLPLSRNAAQSALHLTPPHSQTNITALLFNRLTLSEAAALLAFERGPH